MNRSTDAATGLLLAYYGDDFTGSTDVLDAFTAAGVPTVLFLSPPTPQWLARFPQARCVGLAGTSRARDPHWMARELPAAFDSLKALGAPILQYKVCSTFDSSPTTGSIGCAIDIGLRTMGGAWSPMVVGAPRLRRYQAFGNLFAAVDGVGHRLDRHPTMARHPVTPMAEADLRRHLARQTTRRLELIDFVQLKAGTAGSPAERFGGAQAPVVLIDVLDEETLRAAGRLVWSHRGEGLFSASSSGLQYALAAHWRETGLLAEPVAAPPAPPVPVIAVVSGSCSPVTAGQIDWAEGNGFHLERLDVAALLEPAAATREIARAVAASVAAIARGLSPLIHSARGPDDPAVRDFDATAARAGRTRAEAAGLVGRGLAAALRQLLERAPLARLVVAGGDSSGEVTGALGIRALTVDAPLAPGAPLCRCWYDEADRPALGIVLKGGQVGAADFFGAVRAGRTG